MLVTSAKKIKRILKQYNNDFLNTTENMIVEGKLDEALINLEKFPEIKSNLEALILLGNVYHLKEDTDKALKTFLDADSLCSGTHAGVKHSIGLLYYAKQNYNDAANYLGEAVNYDTGNIQYRLHLAYAYEKVIDSLNDLTDKSSFNISENSDFNMSNNMVENQIKEYIERAKEEYLLILSQDPNFYIALMNLGVLEARSKNYQSSFNFLNKAKALNPTDYKIYLNIGNNYLMDQNFQQACRVYKEAENLQKGNMKILKPYMIALSKIDEWKDLERICKKILEIEKSNTQALALLIRAMKENGNFEELEKVLTKMNKKLEIMDKTQIKKLIEKRGSVTSINSSQAKKELAKTIHKLKKKIRNKLKEIKKSKMFNKEFESVSIPLNDRDDISNFKNLANLFSSRNRKEEAQDYLEKEPKYYLDILKTDKNNKEALFHLSMVYYKRQEYTYSEEFFLKLLALDPKFKGEVVNEKLGDIQFKKYKNTEAAIKYYKEGNKFATTALLFIKIGRCFEKMGEVDKALSEYRKSIDINPNFLWGLFHLGCAYSKLEKDEEALIYLKKAFEIDKDNTDVLSKYTEVLIKSGSLEEINYAIEILQKAKLHYLGNVEIMISLAKGYEKKGNIKDAIVVLEEANAYSEFYSNPNRLFLLAIYYEREKNFMKATYIYKMILAINKEHVQSLVHLGFILFNAKEYKRAFKYFKFALKIDPNLAYAHYGLGRIYQTTKNYEDAIDHYSQCAGNDKNNFKSYFQMGLIYLDMTHLNKAKEMFEKCLEINPEYVIGIAGLGNVLYEMGELQAAEEQHKKAYQLDKEDVQVIISYANTLAGLGKYEESITFYQEALKREPEIADLHYSLANAFYLCDRYSEAIDHYIKSIKIDRNSKSEVFYNLGNALCTQFRYEDAVKCYKQSIKLDYENNEAYYNIANCYYILNNFKKAAMNYEECIKRNYMVNEVKFALCKTFFSLASFEGLHKCENLLKALISEEPENVDYLIHYGNLLEKMNKTEEAIATYKRVLEIDPKNYDAKFNLQSYNIDY